MRIAVVGAGRVGTALAVRWLLAGHEIAVARHGGSTAERHEAYLPGTPLITAEEACSRADVVVIGVPDEAIAEVCERVAPHVPAGAAMLHLSGATGLDALSPARVAGVRVLSVHPLQTFPTVEAALEALPGTTMAVTALDEDGYGLGERLARDAGGEPFRLSDEAKPLYHAAAVFASNYVVAVTAQAAALFGAAGLPDPVTAFMPLARASLENVSRLGPAAALTGPVVRGDAETVRRNLEALSVEDPAAIESYVALARVALRLARDSGRIDEDIAAGIQEVLALWRS